MKEESKDKECGAPIHAGVSWCANKIPCEQHVGMTHSYGDACNPVHEERAPHSPCCDAELQECANSLPHKPSFVCSKCWNHVIPAEQNTAQSKIEPDLAFTCTDANCPERTGGKCEDDRPRSQEMKSREKPQEKSARIELLDMIRMNSQYQLDNQLITKVNEIIEYLNEHG